MVNLAPRSVVVTVPAVVFQRPRDPAVKSVLRRYLFRPVSAGQVSETKLSARVRSEVHETVHTIHRVAAGSSLRSRSRSQGESSPLAVRREAHIEVCRAIERTTELIMHRTIDKD